LTAILHATFNVHTNVISAHVQQNITQNKQITTVRSWLRHNM